MIPFIFATDLHGIEADPQAVRAFKNATAALDPARKAHRVFGGDLWNFAALRRSADEEEKTVRLLEDFKAGLEFLDWFRPHAITLGNHDQRLWDSVKRERVKRSGWLSELAALYVEEFTRFAKKLKIKVYPYNKHAGVHRVEGVAFAHGFGSGGTLTRNMADAYGTVIFGHGHKIVRDTAMKGRVTAAGYQSGCLCRTDMEYVRADLAALRQQQGFIYGVLDGPRSTIIQASIVKGTTGVFTEFKRV